MNHLPNYDQWKLATPEYLESGPPCQNRGCHHDEEEHGPLEDDSGYYTPCLVKDCHCPDYNPDPPERDPDWKRG